MEILTHPNPALASSCSEVDPLADHTLRPLAERMALTMYEAPGVGLAAPQVGVMKRMIVFDVSEEQNRLAVLCNPRVVSEGAERIVEDEGCLSLPGISVPVERATEVVCEGQTLEGTKVKLEAEGFMARMLQHEIDHLDGRLIIDRATPEERKAALRRYRDATEAGARPGETGR